MVPSGVGSKTNNFMNINAFILKQCLAVRRNKDLAAVF